MPSSEAFVVTSRADRYVEQFSKHLAHQPGGIKAESEGEGRLLIDLGAGTCRMWAEPDGLALQAEAPDAERLDQIKDQFAERVEQIGRRDGLQVHWKDAAAGPSHADGAHHEQP